MPSCRPSAGSGSMPILAALHAPLEIVVVPRCSASLVHFACCAGQSHCSADSEMRKSMTSTMASCHTCFVAAEVVDVVVVAAVAAEVDVVVAVAFAVATMTFPVLFAVTTFDEPELEAEFEDLRAFAVAAAAVAVVAAVVVAAVTAVASSRRADKIVAVAVRIGRDNDSCPAHTSGCASAVLDSNIATVRSIDLR